MSSDVAQITYNFEEKKWEGIYVDYVKFLEESYSDCDVVDILTKKMPAWLDSNPTKAHKKNWKRFITNWLSRQQDGYDKFKKFGGKTQVSHVNLKRQEERR